MHSFVELSLKFEQHFNKRQFPESPENLYDAAQYILQLGGKRVRPVAVLMANELFSDLHQDAFHISSAIELFHNFSLIHDDIMDKAPLRRGMDTVHSKYGDSTALLAGDVMLVVAYEHINKISSDKLHEVMSLFNRTAKEVCEGQQLDMDFEQKENVDFESYLNMITLKTSVLLAASLQLGSIIGGAGTGNQQHLYEFGKNLGIAFQIQDDYLDAFGDPKKFGKQVGGDILANKKTILLLKAIEEATSIKSDRVTELIENDSTTEKIELAKKIFEDLNVINFAKSKMNHYQDLAFECLNAINLASEKKNPLKQLALFLVSRDV